MNSLRLCAVLTALLVATPALQLHSAAPDNSRFPATDAEKMYWLQNMIWHHRFTPREITEATYLTEAEITAAVSKFYVVESKRPSRPANAPLLVLPYPGGRHPRAGFLEGAVRPQRETKFSVFTPWDEASYVVVDLPEAIWPNLGLTYLAHTHVPTIWTKAKVELPQLEWKRHPDGTLDVERTLPNGIAFGARVQPARDAVRMELWLKNGTKEKLSDLRVQNCVMLKAASGFTQQTNANKTFTKPYAVCQSADGAHWIIYAWESCDKAWGNAPVPCLHSDPKFPDCEPGETKRLRGWLSFYTGTSITNELERIEKTGWRSQSR